jgi:hypothetical protein
MPALGSQLAKYQAFTCWLLVLSDAAMLLCVYMVRVFYCLPVFTYATRAKRRAMRIYVLGALLFYFILIASTPNKYEERTGTQTHSILGHCANKQKKMLANSKDWAISWHTPTICTMAVANVPKLTCTLTLELINYYLAFSECVGAKLWLQQAGI